MRAERGHVKDRRRPTRAVVCIVAGRVEMRTTACSRRAPGRAKRKRRQRDRAGDPRGYVAR